MCNICEICGDDVDIENHVVCAWHALTIKDDKGTQKYPNEVEYALKTFCSMDTYLAYVINKREKIMNKIRE